MSDIVVEADRPDATVVLLHGTTPEGCSWLDSHVDPDAQRWAGRIVCERRYVPAIVAGAQADGLDVDVEAVR
jgi:hypothetical protein